MKLQRKGKPYTLLVGILMGTVTIENNTVISQKNERELSAIPLWGIYLKKRKSESQRYLQHYSQHQNMETP